MAERIGDGELAVMEALWSAGRPLTAVEIGEIVSPDRNWSESTIKTMLGRLVTKGVISNDSNSRRFRYSPRTGRDDYKKVESRKLVDRLFGGRATSLVAHLAQSNELSDADLEELEALIRDLRR